MTKINPEIENEIIRLRKEDGLSIDKIAQRIGIGNSTIQRIFDKYQVPRKIKITEEVGSKILEFTAQGKYPPEIAKIFGLATSSVQRFLDKQNLPKIGASYTSGVDKEVENKIIAMTAEGMGRAKIASTLGLDDFFIRTLCKRLKISSGNAPSTCKITPEMSIEIVRMISEGWNFSEIGKHFNIYKGTINKYCAHNNIQPRQPTEEELKEIVELRRLRKVFSKAIHRELKALLSDEKYISCTQNLPYSIKELKAHLEAQFEPWMTWDNWGVYNLETWKDDDQTTWVWHIDHIKPCSEFIYKSMQDEQFQKCWALANLRPLSAKQNVSDGATRIRHSN
jgi:transposase-like protein